MVGAELSFAGPRAPGVTSSAFPCSREALRTISFAPSGERPDPAAGPRL